MALLFPCPELTQTSWQQRVRSTHTANVQKRSGRSHPQWRRERQTRQEEQDKAGQGESWQGKARESKIFEARESKIFEENRCSEKKLAKLFLAKRFLRKLRRNINGLQQFV